MDKPKSPASIKPTITLDLLERIDVRVGTIERVDDVKGSDKLVKLTVDFGDHKRTILAGIKQEREKPKEIEGKQALFVVNLEPRKMMGEVSEGMLFDIGYADGLTPVLSRARKGNPKRYKSRLTPCITIPYATFQSPANAISPIDLRSRAASSFRRSFSSRSSSFAR